MHVPHRRGTAAAAAVGGAAMLALILVLVLLAAAAAPTVSAQSGGGGAGGSGADTYSTPDTQPPGAPCAFTTTTNSSTAPVVLSYDWSFTAFQTLGVVDGADVTWTYSLHACGNTPYALAAQINTMQLGTCAYDPTVAPGTSSPSAYACQYRTGSGTFEHALGRWPTSTTGYEPTLIDASNPFSGITFTTANGDACGGSGQLRTTTVNLLCSPLVPQFGTSGLVVGAGPPCGYLFSTQTMAACPVSTPSPMSNATSGLLLLPADTTTTTTTSTAPGALVFDCTATAMAVPRAWIGDGVCNSGNGQTGPFFVASGLQGVSSGAYLPVPVNLNCVQYAFDGGDCAVATNVCIAAPNLCPAGSLCRATGVNRTAHTCLPYIVPGSMLPAVADRQPLPDITGQTYVIRVNVSCPNADCAEWQTDALFGLRRVTYGPAHAQPDAVDCAHWHAAVLSSTTMIVSCGIAPLMASPRTGLSVSIFGLNNLLLSTSSAAAGDTFSMFAPVIVPRTIGLYGSAANALNKTYFNAALGFSQKIAFRVQNVGYSFMSTYVCYGDPTQPLVTNPFDPAVPCGNTTTASGSGWYNCAVDQTATSIAQIVCNTNASTPAGIGYAVRVLYAQSAVLGALMVNATDVIHFVPPPVVNSAYGCPDAGCPTNGGIPITVTGEWFVSPVQVFVNGQPCTTPLIAPATAEIAAGSMLTCTLPAGVGARVPVVVSVNGVFNGFAASDPNAPPVTLDYVPPQLTAIEGCTPSPTHPHAVTNCSRSSTAPSRLTLYGTDFTAQPVVLIGALQCGNVAALPNGTALTCDLPAGNGEGVSVLVVQANGKFSANNDFSVSYMPCLAGTAQNGLQCVLCAPGSYSSQLNAPLCLPCPQGAFANVSGMSHSGCTACEPNFVSPSTGASACRECTGVSYQQASGQSACSTCAQGQYHNAHVTDVSNPCSPCPTDSDDVTCTNGAMYAAAGVWLSADPVARTFKPYRCPQSGACVAGLDCVYPNATGNGTAPSSDDPAVHYCCADGRLPAAQNPLCGACEPGRYLWGGQCVACDGGTNGGLIVLAVVVSWVCVVAFHLLSQSERGVFKVLIYTLQMCVLFFGDATFVTWLSAINLSPFSTAGASCVAPWSPVTQAWVGVLMPVMFVAQLLCTFGLHVLYLRIARSVNGLSGTTSPAAVQAVVDSYIRSLCGVFLFSYSAVASAVFPYFGCDTVSPLFPAVLRLQPAIRCDDPAYVSLRGAFVAIAVCVNLCGPLVMLYALWRHRHSLYSARFLRRYGILYECYRPDCYAYEGLVLARRSLLSAMPVLFLESRSALYEGWSVALLGVLLAHVLLQPQAVKRENTIEFVAHAFLLLLTVTLIPSSTPFTAAESRGYAALLFVPLAVLTCAVTWHWYGMRQTKQQLLHVQAGGSSDAQQQQQQQQPASRTDGASPAATHGGSAGAGSAGRSGSVVSLHAVTDGGADGAVDDRYALIPA